MPKKTDLVELEIESIAFEGAAVGRLDGLVVFVPHAVPGDLVLARLTRKKKNYAEAVMEEVLRPSPHRVEAKCRYFGLCGGCSLQSIEYDQQLIQKRNQVAELMVRLARVSNVPIRGPLPADSYYYYRNKMEFSFGNRRWLTREEIEGGAVLDRQFALGLHISGRFDRILDLEECHLQSLRTAQLVNRVRELAREQIWSAYDARAHQGYLRNLVIRTSRATGEWLVYLVTRESRPDRMRWLADRLLSEFPEIATLINGVNARRSPVARGDEDVIYAGSGFIEELLGPFRFRISRTTFFQPNTVQAEKLYSVVRDYSGGSASSHIYDLYSGIGCISLFLAGESVRVTGIESQAEAVEDARRNARENGVEGCEFWVGKVEDRLTSEFVAAQGRPDVVVMDPPRSGLHPKVIAVLLELAFPRLVYVSCNPATQARDLKNLSARYKVEAIQLVDLFPQTYHIESVALLNRI